MNKHSTMRYIPDVLKAMNETNDIQEITEYENMLACMFASPIMLLGALTNYIFVYLVLHRNFTSTLISSFIFLGFVIMFEIVLRTRISIRMKSLMLTILFSLLFLFFLTRLYYMIGPAIWTFACVLIVLSMSRIKKNMAVVIGLVTFFGSIYIMINSPDYQFQLNYSYFIRQSAVLIILVIVLNIVHQINTDRYLRLLRQIQVEVEQKNDITALYKEIAATEIELRKQNEQLVTYNEEIKKKDEMLYNSAYFDIMTGLPNRKMFNEELDLLTEKSKQQNTVFYVVFIDVDLFKKVNDTMGHHVGDKFMQFTADCLKKSIHKEDLLGRIGGDEFALIISRSLSKEEVFLEIDTLRKSFSQPFKIDNTEIRLTASFGVSVFPHDGNDASEVLKSADMSMYKAKESGRNNVQFFEKYMRDEIIQKTELENKLINAMKNEEFFLVFQPQYVVDGGKTRGFEALIRWRSPELGVVQPIKFIPLTEEMRLIVPLGEWILKTACNKFKTFQEQYGLEACISVNVSTVQLRDVNFIQVVKNILDETGLNPKHLELEITESIFIESFNEAILLLKELRKLGVRIALDDFGTGYSSLSYLKSLPIDTLKIDKSFVDDLSINTSQKQIIGDIISLGHNLGATLIAEGVEYEHQLQYLKEHSCDYVQGFLFNKPLEEEVLRKLFAQGDK